MRIRVQTALGKDHFREKCFKNNQFASSIIEQRSGFSSDITEVSTGAVVGLNSDDFRKCKSHEFNISLDRIKTDVDTRITACSGQ